MSENTTDKKYIFTGYVKSIIFMERQKTISFRAKYPLKRIETSGITKEIIVAYEEGSDDCTNVPSEYNSLEQDMFDVLKWNKDAELIITLKRTKDEKNNISVDKKWTIIGIKNGN